MPRAPTTHPPTLHWLQVDALNLMDQIEAGQVTLDPDVRSAAYETAARASLDYEVYDQARTVAGRGGAGHTGRGTRGCPRHPLPRLAQGLAPTTPSFPLLQLREAYEAAAEVDERQRLLVALGYASQGSRIEASLNYTLSPAVRAQDARTLLLTTAAWAGGGPAGQPPEWGSAVQAWQWLHGNWDALWAKLGGALRRGGWSFLV